MKPFIGVDFDNTIVRYDELFHRLACEKRLIPAHVPVSKEQVRDYLRADNREDDWTELQGYVYGARMHEAAAFPGVLEFFAEAVQRGIDIAIISHKTRHPYIGEQYDLHQAARHWLEINGFFDPSRIGLQPHRVFFEETKAGKLERIGQQRCSHFIDDLPELLREEAFPTATKWILFRPEGGEVVDEEDFFAVLSDWQQLAEFVWTVAP
jgi:hypothetical protein